MLTGVLLPLLVALGIHAQLSAAPSPPPSAPPSASPPGHAAADTIWVHDLSRPRLLDLRAGRTPGAATARLGYRSVSLALPDSVFRSLVPDLRARLPWIVSRVAVPEVRDPSLPRRDFTTMAVLDFLEARARAGAGPPAPVAFLPPAREGFLDRQRGADSAAAAGALASAVSQYADLGVRVSTRAELGGDWTRFRPCTDQFQESCQPSLVPQLSPEMDFAIQVQGTVLDRVQVDVDYDRLREFGAVNTISLVYQGLEDDILQRLAVGDVTFRLPRSRFLTEGIPAGNFGFQADAQLGPVELRTAWAEQRGDVSTREFRLTGTGADRRFVQSDTLVLDDADYARGQFFFLVDPVQVTDYPHVDILALDAGSAPADQVPGFQPVQVYRFDNNPAARQQVEGFIQADAVAEGPGGPVTESGWFRFLVPGQDYFVHPSGLWLALRNPLRRDEMLAVTFITAVGDTVGTYNPEEVFNAGGRPELRLLKASDANHQPGRPTWDREMRQVYRVSASPDVEAASVQVTISLGELSAGRTFKRSPAGDDVTFLQLFGLDAESPLDEVDQAFVYNPGAELFQDPPAVPGTFLVFPTLRPFLEPPPVPSVGLTAQDASELLGPDANGRIYTAEDPFDRLNGGLFRITIPFRVRSEGVISTFSLGALGVLPESERIFLDERQLLSGVDYEIDYDAGLVRLLDPDGLFATAPDAAIRARWEQQQVFRAAPTSVFALNAHSGTRAGGELDVLALYQQEKTLVSRPVLGLEPGAVLLTGLSGGLERPAGWLDRALEWLPGVRPGSSSSVSLDGEVAVSFPTPNTRGAVFLDDFDAADGRPLSLLAGEWQRGSAPASTEGAEGVLPAGLGPEALGRLSWQHNWIVENAQGDSVGIHEGFLAREEIDRQIRVAGSQVREAGLRVRLGTEGGVAPRFATLTTVLNPTGSDLTRSEFLEFYVAGGDPATLVVDLGTVSEDVLFVDDDGLTAGTKENGVPWGLGTLDQEADPALGQVWGNLLDQVGVWGESCLAEPGRIYRLGDPRANCTRGNGRDDSEDLDGDGNLDTAERTLRYVLRLDGTSPFLEKGRDETGTGFRLYRIPIRGAGVEVNGPVTEADLRAVRHIRLTLVSQGDLDLTLARMRIVGSRWIRRSAEGVLTGIIGDTTAFAGRAEVGPVSRLTEGDAYASPPGVLEELSDPTNAVGGQGIEFNERALAVRVEALQPGDRGEVFTRFPQRPRNFLTYREARLWVVPRSGDWAPERPVSFFFKIGTDPENFYLYRSPLRAPAAAGGVATADWLPEVVVDFDVLLELRSRAEELLVLDPPGPGDPPLMVWSADSTHAVVLRDRGRAPDLANVRELALGIWNQDQTPFTGEVWVNELRLSRGDRDPGVAGVLRATLDGGGFLDADLSLSTRSGTFRQLRETPSYQTDRRFTLNARARLERLTPADWGVELPLSLVVDDSNLDPRFLTNSDVRADRLRDLRETGSRRTQLSLGFRKVTPSANPWVGALVDGLEGNVSLFRVRNATVTTRVESRGVDARVGYARRLEPREVDPVPGFLEPVLRALLPPGLEESLLGARLRWAPERFRVGTVYRRRDDDLFRFSRIIETSADAEVTPTESPRENLELSGELVLSPVPSLTAEARFRSLRDLLRPNESVSDPRVQALLATERASLAGMDLGWETDRSLTTRLRYAPRFWSWLQHEVGWSTRYGAERNTSFTRLDPASGADSALVLERNVRVERTVEWRAALEPAQVARVLSGSGEGGAIPTLLRILRPVTLSVTDGVTSRFNRAAVDPGLGFQFAVHDAAGLRLLQGDTAATLTDGLSRRVGWGIGGARASLDAAWARSDVAVLDARADREILSRTWPDLRARLADVPALDRLAPGLTRLALSLGYVRSERETLLGEGLQTRRNEEVQIPWDLTLAWQGTLVTSYRGSVLDGDGEDPTGDTERDRVTHRFSITSSFLPPLGLGGPTPGPVRVSVIASYTAERECRVPRAREDCVAFVDQLNRALSLAMDTRLSDFQVGLQAGYTDRRSFVGRRVGSTQFQLSLFGQFLFEGGRFADGGGFPLPGD
ncbi:MAG: hypothetical protein RQ751_06785 [Longimicrobiales bacterium]|nr:hypothetical protein [Longimicrobiales bacterium]